MSRERSDHLFPKDERFALLRDVVLAPEERPRAAPDLVDIRTVRLVEWEETVEATGQILGVTIFRVDVRVQDGTPWLSGPQSTHEEGAFATCALGLALAQGILPEHILLAAAAHEEAARVLSEKAAEHHGDVVLHALTIASGAAAVGVESVRLPSPRALVRGPFAFLAGAARTAYQARADLAEVAAYCAENQHFGPGGMAHVAGEKLSAGASDEELWVLIRSCIYTARMFRPTSRFDFVSYFGTCHGAYCLVAWILWGVIRHRRARTIGLLSSGAPLRTPTPSALQVVPHDVE